MTEQNKGMETSFYQLNQKALILGTALNTLENGGILEAALGALVRPSHGEKQNPEIEDLTNRILKDYRKSQTFAQRAEFIETLKAEKKATDEQIGHERNTISDRLGGRGTASPEEQGIITVAPTPLGKTKPVQAARRSDTQALLERIVPHTTGDYNPATKISPEMYLHLRAGNPGKQ